MIRKDTTIIKAQSLRQHSYDISQFLLAVTLILSFLGLAQPVLGVGPSPTTSEQRMKPLTVEEARIILEKSTERPFTGQYLHNKTAGVYLCRQCGAELYRSTDKFDSGCGWPAFDDAIPGAVLRKPDADGHRVEIVCAQCKGHLGHVFEGEGFTAKNTRHCVNSLSMSFVPEVTTNTDTPQGKAPAQGTAIFAGGCFWGVEDEFSKMPGVLDAVSGYIGGKTSSPTYDEVSRGNSGHAEAVRIIYDPGKVSFEQLARRFFEIHDPTQKNRQGPDVGTQYRSAVFYQDEEQKTVTEKLVGLLQGKGWKVVTEIVPASTFYPAEDYHQDFTKRTGRGGCHLRVSRFDQGPRF